MAHTPGPWRAFNADYQGRPDEAPIFVVGPSQFHTVAQVRAGNTDDDLPAQTPANARLIAAAPTLATELAVAAGALTEAAKLLRDGLSGCADIMDAHAARARAAIAKATGEPA